MRDRLARGRPSIRVELTRTADHFVPLRQRYALAEDRADAVE